MFLQRAFETKTLRLSLFEQEWVFNSGDSHLYFLPHQDHPVYPTGETGS